MMTFTTLPKLAHFIDKHHEAFGCPILNPHLSTLSILGELNKQIRTSGVVGATYKAWMKIPDYGLLLTYITVEKHPDGYWIYTERTVE